MDDAKGIGGHVVAAQMDLKIEQGADFYLTMTYLDENGLPVNLTNYTALMRVRASKDSTVNLAEYSTANSKITITGASGIITIRETAANTSAYTWVKGVFDLTITPPAGSPSALSVRLLEGNAVLSRGVSV